MPVSHVVDGVSDVRAGRSSVGCEGDVQLGERQKEERSASSPSKEEIERIE